MTRKKRRTKGQIQEEAWARYRAGEITREQFLKLCPWQSGDSFEKDRTAKKTAREGLPPGVTCTVKNGSTYYYARVGERKRNSKGEIITVPTYFGEGEGNKHRAIAARLNFQKKEELKKADGRMIDGGMEEEAKKRRQLAAEFKTFRELIGWYLNLDGIQQLKSYKQREGQCRIWLAFLGDCRIRDLDDEKVKEYVRWRTKGGHEYDSGTVDLATGKPIMRTLRPSIRSSINEDIQCLKSILKKAKKKVPQVDIDAFSRSKALMPPRRLVKDEEYERMVTEIDDQDMLDVITCGWETAMRATEIAQLRKGWIHLDKVVTEVPYQVASYIELPYHITKTKKQRIIPVSGTLRRVLERRCEGLSNDELVFTRYYPLRGTRNGWGASYAVTREFKKHCAKLGIPYGDHLKDESGEPLLTHQGHRVGITFHCFRGTRITKWIEEGYSDAIIMLASGHANVKVFHERYAKPREWAVMRLVNGDSGISPDLMDSKNPKNDKNRQKSSTTVG